MQHHLTALPYNKNALSPYISEETLTYHHDEHHGGYVKKLNELIKGTEFEDLALEDIIVKAKGDIFNNAAQIWNHEFFWKCLSPKGGGEPHGEVAELITKKWHTFSHFKEEFTKFANENFGSGWTWLVQNDQGELGLLNTSNANDPLPSHLTAILTVDIWEHAYYIDYRNSRDEFLGAFWSLVNWDFANENLN